MVLSENVAPTLMTLPDQPFGLTIFCDDIRHEVTGKTTLVGVYGHSMIFHGDPPGHILQMVLAIHYVEPAGQEERVELRVFGPGSDEPIVIAELVPAGPRPVPPPTEELQRVSVRTSIPLQNFLITEPGRLKVDMMLGETLIKAGSLEIQFLGMPEVEDQTPSQSNFDERPL